MQKFMEDNLDMPLSDVLARIQEGVMERTTYFGIPTHKNPNDAWVYQQLIVAMRPDVIVEIGTKYGGSTLYLAHLCDLLGHGRVISVDSHHGYLRPEPGQHPRVSLILSDACAAFPQVRTMIAPHERVLVIEDSSHTYDNTLAVLRTYSPLTRPGDHFIVEDSICHHGLSLGPAPGPYEAIETFVQENADFEVDRSQEALFITWNPKGFLRRRELSPA
ncbi:CmcI family methyltransferase [Arenimonas alkanexedens]